MDITKCENTTCINRNKCYRYTAQSNEFQQYYCKFEPIENTEENFKCEYFLNNYRNQLN
jgi:hypothetical protein